MYNLKKNDNGDVWFIMKAGSSYVKASMPYGKAMGIIESASDITKSDKFEGFEISVNDCKYFFAGNFKSEDKKPADDTKPEDKASQEKENHGFKKNKWHK
jgi:hypothetical protein